MQYSYRKTRESRSCGSISDRSRDDAGRERGAHWEVTTDEVRTAGRSHASAPPSSSEGRSPIIYGLAQLLFFGAVARWALEGNES
jgi:hypothetical protein